MTRIRLDQQVFQRHLAVSRKQASDFIRRSMVSVNGKIITNPNMVVDDGSKIIIKKHDDFVSRAGEKLASAAEDFNLNFKDKIVLDVGSSTGGFTDLALKNGASKVVAIEKGTRQMRPELARNPRVELHEKTDILDFNMPRKPDVILVDVSFMSLKRILPHITELSAPQTEIVAMVKPQFEASEDQKVNGIIKNSAIRRQILRDFEIWLKNNHFIIQSKRDSKLAGAKGNIERFYLLRSIR